MAFVFDKNEGPSLHVDPILPLVPDLSIVPILSQVDFVQPRQRGRPRKVPIQPQSETFPNIFSPLSK